MKKILPLLLVCSLVIGTCYHLFFWPDRAIETVVLSNAHAQTTLIIDPGHGGVDGGAVSEAGTIESHINLEVALRLDQLLGLFGTDVLLLRSEDSSLHDDSATTIREKKNSDLHNRVATIEETANATVISIHQNTYAGSTQYKGAQVFYSTHQESQPMAEYFQEQLRLSLDPDNQRSAALIPDSVYLMNHISCPAVLVECGFLSNPEEDALLQTSTYQTKLATAIAGAYLGYRTIQPN